MSDLLEGSCGCGQVRYEVEGPPMIVHCCHCHWCQRETGSAFAINALIEADRVRVTQGTEELIQLPSESGQGQRIARCPHCRTALWSHYAYAGIGDRVKFLRVGTLETPDACPPDVHIYTASKQLWVQLPEGALSFDAYYRAKEVWPDASLARREALRQ